MLTAYIENIEPGRFLFSIDIPDAGTELYQQTMKAKTFDDAATEASELLFEFLVVGIEDLGDFSFSLRRPSNEVRFTQICCGEDDELYALDGEGVVYVRKEVPNPRFPADTKYHKKIVWVRMSMERGDIDEN